MRTLSFNLLPYREAREKKTLRKFPTTLAAFIMVACVLLAITHAIFVVNLSRQESRNQMLDQEIVKLESQLTEIKAKESLIQQALVKKSIVDNLAIRQNNGVNLFNHLLKVLPEDVFLKTVRQTGTKIQISGLAYSNARISEFLRNLQNSTEFSNPELGQISSTSLRGARLNEFSISFDLKKLADLERTVNEVQKKQPQKKRN